MVQFIKDLWRKSPVILVIVIAVLAFTLGLLIRGGGSSDSAKTEHDHSAETAAQAEVWTCSMHPNVRQPGPGQCPICGMDLIPAAAETADDDSGMPTITLSAKARKLAEIQVAPVERRNIPVEIRLAGKIEYDETTQSKIAAWVPGRLEKLFVDYTGLRVAKGAPMVELYSPELLTGQQELLAALKIADNLAGNASENILRTARRTVEAAREKLRRWGLTNKQIREIEHRGIPKDRLTITAPIGGVVVHKNAFEGMYVKTGTPIYTIADLSHLWVMLDAYEADLGRIAEKQRVDFSTVAYPGETFTGTVAFIDPMVNEKTRSIKVRVELPNPQGKLKPGMFVNAVVKAESPHDQTGEPPLMIPASAPLITGKRAVVYVAVPGEEGKYEGREVVLGPRSGDYYVVREGLAEGEMVVVNGNFKIDSAVQLLAKRSMMSPESGAPPVHHHGGGGTGAEDMAQKPVAQLEEFEVPEQFGTQLAGVFAGYFKIQNALSHDKFPEVKSAAESFTVALDSVKMKLLQGAAHMAWMEREKSVRTSAASIAAVADIAAARVAFEPLSESMYAITVSFGAGLDDTVYQIHCPMAFKNKGADWLQTKTVVENPYFGAKMFKCGKVTDTLPPRTTDK